MPSLQTVDLGDQGYKKRKGIGGFMDEVQDAYRGHQERSAIDEILGEYKKNMGDAQAYEKMQMGLMQDNRIGPKKRLETQSQLDNMQKTIIEKDKVLNAKYKSEIDDLKKEREETRKAAAEAKKAKEEETVKANKKKVVADTLRLGGETDEAVIEEKSNYMSPEDARFEATRKLNGTKQPKLLGGAAAQKDIQTKIISPIQEAGKKASELLMSAQEYRQAIENMKEGSQYYKKALNVIPFAKGPLENVFNADEQTISSLTKKSIVGSGELKGLRITDEKLRYLQGALPGPLKDYEANVAAYDIWEKMQNLLVEKQKVLNEFITELSNSGATDYPPDFDAQLNDRYEDAGLVAELNNIVKQAKEIPGNEYAPKVKFDELPDPKEFSGKTIKDDKTGKKFYSNGKAWVAK